MYRKIILSEIGIGLVMNIHNRANAYHPYEFSVFKLSASSEGEFEFIKLYSDEWILFKKKIKKLRKAINLTLKKNITQNVLLNPKNSEYNGFFGVYCDQEDKVGFCFRDCINTLWVFVNTIEQRDFILSTIVQEIDFLLNYLSQEFL